MSAWPRQSECLARFGNPSMPGWGAKNVVRVPVPWAMRMGDIPIASIKINRIAADSLTRVLAAIWQACGHSQAHVAGGHCDCFSGDWAIRPIRGGHMPSMHSFALALDFDAAHNALGAPDGKTFFHAGSIIVKAFKAGGWTWGGDWTGRRDAMHFQAAAVG